MAVYVHLTPLCSWKTWEFTVLVTAFMNWGMMHDNQIYFLKSCCYHQKVYLQWDTGSVTKIPQEAKCSTPLFSEDLKKQNKKASLLKLVLKVLHILLKRNYFLSNANCSSSQISSTKRNLYLRFTSTQHSQNQTLLVHNNSERIQKQWLKHDCSVSADILFLRWGSLKKKSHNTVTGCCIY